MSTNTRSWEDIEEQVNRLAERISLVADQVHPEMDPVKVALIDADIEAMEARRDRLQSALETAQKEGLYDADE